VQLAEGFSMSGQTILMIASAIVLSALFFLVFERTRRRQGAARDRVNASARAWSASVRRAPLCSPTAARRCWPADRRADRAGHDDVLRLRFHHRPEGVRRRDHRRARQLPATAAGALAVGLVESFASFWSGALKDVIVFSLLIPVLMLRSFLSVHAEEEDEEIDA
jgi:branched-chain amino acid transport system permease protein